MDRFEIAMNLTLKALEEKIIEIGSNGKTIEEVNADNAKQIADFYKTMFEAVEKCR